MYNFLQQNIIEKHKVLTQNESSVSVQSASFYSSFNVNNQSRKSFSSIKFELMKLVEKQVQHTLQESTSVSPDYFVFVYVTLVNLKTKVSITENKAL